MTLHLIKIFIASYAVVGLFSLGSATSLLFDRAECLKVKMISAVHIALVCSGISLLVVTIMGTV